MKYAVPDYIQRANYDPTRAYLSSLKNLVELSRTAAMDDAYSYRNFRVGAALLAINVTNHKMSYFAAGNVKAKAHDNPTCAEYRIIRQASTDKRGFGLIPGLVVAGTTDLQEILDVTGAATPTLHPCHRCRDNFEASPMISDDALIVSVGISKDQLQFHTKKQMRDLYADGYPAPDAQVLPLQALNTVVDNYDILTRAEGVYPLHLRRSAAQIGYMALAAAA